MYDIEIVSIHLIIAIILIGISVINTYKEIGVYFCEILI